MLRAEHAADAVRVNELLIRARIERAPRAGVVTADEFGAAAVTIADSDLRGQILTYESPLEILNLVARRAHRGGAAGLRHGRIHGQQAADRPWLRPWQGRGARRSTSRPPRPR